ncbi:MAG: four helix bundle protein [Bacteroidia bacterium]
MIDDLYKRAKTLSKACMKIALVLPADQAIAIIIRSHLIDTSSKMAIGAKGVMSTQVQTLFLQNMNEAKQSADACQYWLEMVKDEGYLEDQIIDPILKESMDINHLLALAIKKIKPSNY